MPTFRIDSFAAIEVMDLESIGEGVPFIMKNEVHVYSKKGKHTLIVRLTGEQAPVAREYRSRGNARVATFPKELRVDARNTGSLIEVRDNTVLTGCLLVLESGGFCICTDLSPRNGEPVEAGRIGYLPTEGGCEFHDRSRVAVADEWILEWRDPNNKLVLTLASGESLWSPAGAEM